MNREPMKTLSQQKNKISRDFEACRDAIRAWLDAATSKLFPTPAPVRVAARQPNRPAIRRRP